MTAKEQAIALVNKFDELARDFTKGVSMAEFSKQCALIAVNEVLDALEEHRWQNRLIMDYWEEVKTEIKKL
jgi:hypothetical protein